MNRKQREEKISLEEIIKKESQLEMDIYDFLTAWKKRHPLLAITLCTMLGVVLLSLLVGIMQEAIVHTFIK